MNETSKINKFSEHVHDVLLIIAKEAYKQGRNHQLEEDFPDVGMGIKNKFEDTQIYKDIMESKPK